MPFKVMIHDVVMLWREVELPERCPGFDETKNAICDADLTQIGAVKIFEYADQMFRGNLNRADWRGDDIDIGYAAPEQGDDHVEVAYHCSQCDHEFVQGEFIRHEGSAGLWTDIKKLVEE
jgi:hypothetical protein